MDSSKHCEVLLFVVLREHLTRIDNYVATTFRGRANDRISNSDLTAS